MRALLILAAALMFGLAGGYAWAELSAPRRHVHVPKAINPPAPPVIESTADVEWSNRAENEPESAAKPAENASEQPANP